LGKNRENRKTLNLGGKKWVDDLAGVWGLDHGQNGSVFYGQEGGKFQRGAGGKRGRGKVEVGDSWNKRKKNLALTGDHRREGGPTSKRPCLKKTNLISRKKTSGEAGQ